MKKPALVVQPPITLDPRNGAASEPRRFESSCSKLVIQAAILDFRPLAAAIGPQRGLMIE